MILLLQNDGFVTMQGHSHRRRLKIKIHYAAQYRSLARGKVLQSVAVAIYLCRRYSCTFRRSQVILHLKTMNFVLRMMDLYFKYDEFCI